MANRGQRGASADRVRGPVRRVGTQQAQMVQEDPGDAAEREASVARLGELQEGHVEAVRLRYAQALVGPGTAAGEVGEDGRHPVQDDPLRRARGAVEEVALALPGCD